ncbi:hypothetical protein CCR75_003014 [Bremia lactucae]|uniref:tRNA pseudouridine synthase n=1 Tax=Bremia lactucae TaxID=4779 RepID=A0A976FFE9_BRELC|nr:hypothetical protein CCR75_003014 [Bremia lactucae]
MRGSRQLRIPFSAFLRVDASGPLTLRRCIVEYDGADFCGFQAQDKFDTMRTVQEVIEDAIQRTTGETALPRLRFASRTDAGVHAIGQVIVIASRCIEPDRIFRDSLNTRLPQDIVCHSVVWMSEAEADFDPCSNAKRKCYEYTILAGGLRPVFSRRNVWHIWKPLDLAKMQEAIDYFMAPPAAKDFSSFTPQKSDDEERNNVCVLSAIRLYSDKPLSAIRLYSDKPSDKIEAQYQEDVATRIRLVFEGNRFRYKMVRNLVGTIIDVGLGRLKSEDIPAIVAARNRGMAGQGAPPQGLKLMWVKYD